MNVSELEAHRPRLTALATRILSSNADADDVVQEAWLRALSATDIDDLPAWLTTVVTRLCLDHLRRYRTRATAEAGAPLTPEPGQPEADAIIAERVSDAMQLLLDTLAPAERAAFVMHDVFGYPFDEIAAVLGRSETAARQLASRARRKLRGAPEPPSHQEVRAENRRVVEAFLAAARGGQLSTLLSLLAPDAVMHVDRVGQRMGAHRQYAGAAEIAARFDGAQGAMPALIDGELGAAWVVGDAARVAFAFQVEDGLLREIELIADPEVLAMLEIVPVGREH